MKLRYPWMWAILLLMASRALGQAPCVPIDYRSQVPFAVDANVIQGLVLPGIMDATAGPRWELPSGKFNRSGTCCDAEGDPIAIKVLLSPTPATVEVKGGTWTLACDLLPGLNLIVVEATDDPSWRFGQPMSRLYTVIVNGTAPLNTAPVLL